MLQVRYRQTLKRVLVYANAEELIAKPSRLREQRLR